MDSLQPLIEAFDMLDIVLAVFGAVIVSMWFGRGKGPWALISGAITGGLIKPMFVVFLAGGAVVAMQGTPEIKQTPEQQDATLKFWSK